MKADKEEVKRVSEKILHDNKKTYIALANADNKLAEPHLKPCAHCGGKAELIRVTESYPLMVMRRVRIRCYACGINITREGTIIDAELEAISAWNTRVGEKK